MNKLTRISSTGRAVRDHLKLHLRAKKITYSAIAKELRVSEVSVKRWLTSHDLKYENFVKICRFAGLNPATLEDQKNATQFLGKYFSEEQEDYLSKHPLEFLVFTKAVMGHSFDEVLEFSELTLSQFLRVLRRLEAQRLLLLETGNRFRILHAGPFRWRSLGSLERTYFAKFREVINAHFRLFEGTRDLPEPSDISLFRPFEFYLDPDHAFEFSSELARLVQKYRAISHKSIRRWHKAKPVAGVVAVDFLDAWTKVYLNKG